MSDKGWIGDLKMGDSVLVGMGPWTPDLLSGTVVEIIHSSFFYVKIQVGKEVLSFDAFGTEISPWPVIDGSYLARPQRVN
ncbi:hypothetical protein GCM10008959_34390 [Deinococcus seoulensis]|uniref:Uncharacterized protein n=1 Tax=Deinococcus seoulensis TaxID=1837379 RepID=A0ABQ2RUV9_9DEIO|nr:hypothetical protein GCM10008959_34390 [Deinococcus seoulensis]